MKNCNHCGAILRDDSVFCSSCGKSVGNESAVAERSPYDIFADTEPEVVPLITLSPAQNSFSAKRIIGAVKTVVAIVLVVVVALGGVALWAYLDTDPFAQSAINTVEDDTYKRCLALVRDVRNENFREYIDDYVNMTGVAEGKNFYTEYETLLREIIPDDSETEAVMFRDCCFMVSCAEFAAKRYESLADSGLFGLFYRKDADTYRTHADKLYEMLVNAQTQEELQAIIDYCEENKIVERK